MTEHMPRRELLWRLGGGLGGIALADYAGPRRPARRHRARRRTEAVRVPT